MKSQERNREWPNSTRVALRGLTVIAENVLDLAEFMGDIVLGVDENPVGVDVSHLLRLAVVPYDLGAAAAVESCDPCTARNATASFPTHLPGHGVGAVSTVARSAVPTIFHFIVIRGVSVSFAPCPTLTRMTTGIREARLLAE